MSIKISPMAVIGANRRNAFGDVSPSSGVNPVDVFLAGEVEKHQVRTPTRAPFKVRNERNSPDCVKFYEIILIVEIEEKDQKILRGSSRIGFVEPDKT